MKALKFPILLCGLLFFINGTLTAQFDMSLVTFTPQEISMEGSVNTPQNGEPFILTVTVSSIIAITLGIEYEHAEIQSSGGMTGEHTFNIPIEENKTEVHISCGNIDGSGEYHARDGGCTITIIPGFTF